MNSNYLWLLAIGIGIVAGLRALTAPAVVSWAAHLGWLGLRGTPLAFMASPIAVGVFTLGALFEYVTDQLPKTPPRTAPPGFIARIVTGGFSAACLYVGAGQSWIMGSLFGVLGAVIGTLGGYQARTRLVRGLNVKDIFIAIPEDLVALGVGLFIVSR